MGGCAMLVSVPVLASGLRRVSAVCLSVASCASFLFSVCFLLSSVLFCLGLVRVWVVALCYLGLGSGFVSDLFVVVGCVLCCLTLG